LNDISLPRAATVSDSSAAPPNQAAPVVSVIVAVLNEENHVDELIRSILAQDLDESMELLLIDGMSTDKTRERILAATESSRLPNRQIRVLDNPKRRSPYAFNIGIREARGEFFCLFGAHASYEPNYIRECLSVIRSSPNRVACGGVIRTLSNGSFQGDLTVDVLTNPFGSSKTSFRTQGAGTVDNIPFPVIRVSELRDAGGYDERLHRNEDNEMNGRLIERGVELRITDKTTASYYPVGTTRKLMAYGRRNGWWNAKMIALGLSGLRIRHFVPSAFVVGLIGATAAGSLGRGLIRRLGLFGMAAALGTHFALGTKETLNTQTRTKGPARLLVPFLIMGFHLSYGYGTISYLFSKKEPGT
jgi:succinoglycan biosynthesis protein ExoA